ncbi:unnamed protein product [Hermetia illucens]|uniref:Riboflavin transporter n=1 Tax=Hermetia illucens TaxID=343691 RepID=A0A7R8UNX6_HERIL|nr:unnamed protein product [Hermetia illucens]
MEGGTKLSGKYENEGSRSRPHLNEFDRGGVSSINASDKITEDSALLAKMHPKITKLKESFQNRSLVVDFLAILFGVGTWIGVNSTYVQLPLLVETAPEGWSLPSFLVVIIQLGNIGPLLYTLRERCSNSGIIKDSQLIYVLLVIGTIASILMSFMYTQTSIVANRPYSVSLFALVFFLALTGCTSSVLFMPYMGRFAETYLIMYFVGEGLSGFLPSVVALIQGNSNAMFRQRDLIRRFFFFFVFAMMICSTIAFFLLDNLKVCKKFYVTGKIGNGHTYEYDETETTTKQEIPKILSRWNYGFLLFLMAVVCLFGNGVFPSLQSYSCLPYGNVAYHLAVTFSSMANPIACFMAIFLPHTNIRSIVIMIVCGSVFTSYALVTASLSPSPPLINTTIGEVLIIFCWTILMGLVSYIKLCITTVMRSQGGKSLLWVGAIGQVGSAVGSILTFVLVNVLNLFESYQPC